MELIAYKCLECGHYTISKYDGKRCVKCNGHLVPYGKATFADKSISTFTEKRNRNMKLVLKKDDNTEVEIMENIDYGDTDLRSIIEGDKNYHNDDQESYGSYGFSKQEFEGEELVDVEEDTTEEVSDEEELLDF